MMRRSVGTVPLSCEKKHLPGRGLTEVEKHCSKWWLWKLPSSGCNTMFVRYVMVFAPLCLDRYRCLRRCTRLLGVTSQKTTVA